MPILKSVQSDFSTGVIDRKAHMRIDAEAYFSGVQQADEVIQSPQGGLSRRPGKRYIGKQLPRITRISADITMTAPNGGTAANANDDDVATLLTTTTNISTTDNYVVAHADLGSAKAILMVDAVDTLLTNSPTTASLNEFQLQYSLDDSVWVDFGTAFETVNGTESNTYRRTATNDVAITAQYWRIIRSGTTDLGTGRAQISEFTLWEAGSLGNSLFIEFAFSVTQDYLLVLTERNLRVYSDDVYQVDVRVPYTDAQVPDVKETQSADTLLTFMGDVQPQRITRTSNTTWDVQNLALSNIPTFDFGSGAEAVISATRGWPKSGTFHEARLVLGGTKSKPNSILMSKTNDFFNLDNGTGLDDEGIFATLDTDQVNAINAVYSSRHLQVFTTGGEFFVPVSPITPSKVAFLRQSKYGSEAVPVDSIDGSTVFVQRKGKALREFVFAFAEDAYLSNSITLLANSLINNPVRLATQPGISSEDASYLYVVNGDGTVAVLNTVRQQNITSWTRWATDNHKDVVHLLEGGAVYFMVERTINGETVRYIEKTEEGALLDASIKKTVNSTVVTGLEHLEGEMVKVIADGSVLLDKTVSSGQITLERSAIEVEVGKNYIPMIKTLPLSVALRDGVSMGEIKGTIKVIVNVINSGGLTVNGYKIPNRSFGSNKFGQPPETKDGFVEIYLRGWDRQALLTFQQEEPDTMTLLGYVHEVYH